MALNGLFQGLKLNAGGAFAAYFATLLASVFVVNNINERIHDLTKSYWVLTAKLAIRDEQGNEVPPPQSGVTVSFDPTTVSVSGDQLKAIVPGEEGDWPTIRVDVPGFGARTFVLDHSKMNYETVGNTHALRVLEPLVVRKPPTVGFGKLPATTVAGVTP